MVYALTMSHLKLFQKVVFFTFMSNPICFRKLLKIALVNVTPTHRRIGQ